MNDREQLTSVEQALRTQADGIHAHLYPPVDGAAGAWETVGERPISDCRPDGTQTWELVQRNTPTLPQNGGTPYDGPTQQVITEERACDYVPPPVDMVLGPEEIVEITPLTACRPDGTQDVKISWIKDVLVPAQYGGAEYPTEGTRTELRSCTYIPPTPVPTGQHGFFEMVAKRPDAFVLESLRDAARLKQLTRNGVQWSYDPQHDTDPRRQDAAKLIIPVGSLGPGEQLSIRLGSHGQDSLFLSWDRWWGKEHDYYNTGIGVRKGDPYLDSGMEENYCNIRTCWAMAKHWPENQPPGGPFLLFVNPQMSGSAVVKPPFWRDGTAGFPRHTVPYTEPDGRKRRGYGESVAPFDTRNNPAGNEFGVKAETWTRFQMFYERDPSEDWTHATRGPREAWRYYLWCSDVNREPICVVWGAILGVVPGSGGFTNVDFHLGVGNGYVDSETPTRGPLAQYICDFASTRGTSRAEVEAALVKKPTAA